MKRRIFLFIVAVMLMVLTACGFSENREKSATQAEYGVTEEFICEYETDLIRYGEPSGAFSFRKDVERTQTDYAVYYFELSISEQERQACIEVTDRVLSCIDGTLPELEIAVFTNETFDGVAVSGNRFYTSIQPWDSAEYLAGVLLAGYSEWGSYGMAYGYANHLCKEAGLDYREVCGFQQMSNTELYDLNLLCFNEKFVSPQDVEAAKNNACLFVDEYLSAHSDTEFLGLLAESGTTEGVRRANEALEAFYIENGVDCSLTEIRYQYGGVTLDYAAACEYASFYIDKDWQDGTWETNPMISERFLHEDYGEVKAFFECSSRQMEQYQELFDFDSYNNDLLVFVSNTAGFYEAEKHTIYLTSIVHLMHEYIHSVMYGHCDWNSQWKTEGVARYFSYKYDDYSYDYLNRSYNESQNEYIQEYLNLIGRPIDIKIDFRELEDIMVHVRGYTDPNLVTDNYLPNSSFVGYLVDQYGEEATIQYVCSDEEYNAEWGKSYEDLAQDWNRYIEENYSQYSRK